MNLFSWHIRLDRNYIPDQYNYILLFQMVLIPLLRHSLYQVLFSLLCMVPQNVEDNKRRFVFDIHDTPIDPGWQLCYTTPVTGSTYRGVALLPTHPLHNGSLVHNPTYVWPGGHMPDEEKYFFLDGSDPAHQVHTSYEASDWSGLVSAGPFHLGPGESVVLAFALVAAVILTTSK